VAAVIKFNWDDKDEMTPYHILRWYDNAGTNSMGMAFPVAMRRLLAFGTGVGIEVGAARPDRLRRTGPGPRGPRCSGQR
jgi:hypothetical protein